jgi:hypothetical protein
LVIRGSFELLSAPQAATLPRAMPTPAASPPFITSLRDGRALNSDRMTTSADDGKLE